MPQHKKKTTKRPKRKGGCKCKKGGRFLTLPMIRPQCSLGINPSCYPDGSSRRSIRGGFGSSEFSMNNVASQIWRNIKMDTRHLFRF